jgi:hypothetical protein
MAISFNPASGSTIAFGNVVVGSNSNQSVSVSFTSPNNSDPGQFSYTTDTSTITGAQASMFSGDMNDSFFGPGNDGDSHLLTFTPSALGAATATLTWTYTLVTNGVSAPGTGTYTLTGTGISNPSPPPATEVTSLLQSFRYLLVPSQGTTGKVLSFYDTTSLNDATDNSVYTFKAEDIHADRVPTVRRVIITYIDLGVASIVVNVSGINDNGTLAFGQAVISIGTVGATQNICTAYADLSVSCYRPQVTLTRNGAGGPIAISHVVATGTIEKDVSL